MIRVMALVLGVLAVSLSGCSTMQNTPKQDYVSALLGNCVSKFPGTTLNRVEADGRWWINYQSPSALSGVQTCMAEQFKAHPYLDWVKARQAAMPSAASPPSVAGPVIAPVWQVGDAWEYAYKSPSGSGTYVWSVDRIEVLDGVPHYVIKSGTREIFDRVSDLANSLERVDGVVILREVPSRLAYMWPLTVGKTWELVHRQERPVDRTTTDRNSLWTVESEETVTVVAGTFRTLKITWRNRNNGALIYEQWYAPSIKQSVKIREVLSNGIRERELLTYKLK